MGNDNRQFFSVRDDGTSAAIRWTYDPGSGSNKRMYSPAVYYDPTLSKFIIVFTRNDGTLYALRDDETSYTLLWSYSIGGDPESPPIIANGVVYVGSTNGILSGIRLSDGILLFTTDLGNDNFTSFAVGHNLLFVGSDQNKIYAFGKP